MTYVKFRTLYSNFIETESLEELLNFDNYDNITWLQINNASFTKNFNLPKSLINLYVSSCHHVGTINPLPLNIKYVEIKNSYTSSLDNLFSLNEYKNIETLNLSCNRLIKLPRKLPQNIISIDLSHNDITKLPQNNCFSQNIHHINLTHNQLHDLPEWLLELNENTIVNLMPNKFWFNTYSDIGLNRVIYDYHIEIANRFFNNSLRQKLIQTRNIINNVERRVDFYDAPIINIQPTKTTIKTKTTAEQAQNVHNSDIQDSFSKSVKNIMANTAPKIDNYLDSVWWYYAFDSYNIPKNLEFVNYVKSNCGMREVVSRNGVTYGQIFERIWAISQIHEHKIEIRKVLRQEIESGRSVCFTGRITRLVNTLTGFINEVQIGYSENEQINNTVIAIMRRHEENPDINVHDEVKKALDELNIPEETQQIWLDALE